MSFHRTERLKKRYVIFGLFSLLSIWAGNVVYQSLTPDIQLMNGQTFKWRELEGNWVVINYFAPWCAPCLREIPELNTFHQNSHQYQSMLLGVSFDQMSREKLRSIQSQYNISFPLLDPELNQALLNERPKNLPATFIVSPQGELVKVILGEQSAESLIEHIHQLATSL